VCCRYVRRHHPYTEHKELNSVRPSNVKLQTVRPLTDSVKFDSDIENKNMTNKVDCGRKQDVSASSCKLPATSTDRSSKWSKFLSSDIVNDGSAISSQLDSDCVDEDSSTRGCSTDILSTSSMVSATFLL